VTAQVNKPMAKRALKDKADRFRRPDGLTAFLEASVNGLMDLPFDEVVSLAFMFNWADTRQRDVVEGLTTFYRGDRLCIKAALPNSGPSNHGNNKQGIRRSKSFTANSASYSENGNSASRDSAPSSGSLFQEQSRDWSNGFSLDALNIDQSLLLHSWPDKTGSPGLHRPRHQVA